MPVGLVGAMDKAEIAGAGSGAQFGQWRFEYWMRWSPDKELCAWPPYILHIVGSTPPYHEKRLDRRRTSARSTSHLANHILEVASLTV